MTKKLISLLLALVMCHSLAACGGNDTNDDGSMGQQQESNNSEQQENSNVMTKDEMLSYATELGDYVTEMSENILRAEEKYVGNIFYVTGLVSNITGDSVDVGDFSVSLPKEDIIKLNQGQQITVVGRIDSLIAEDSQEMISGTTYTSTKYHGVMSNAYFVSDTYELSGTLIFYYMKLMDIDGKNHNRYGQEEAWAFGLDMVDDIFIAVEYSMKEDIPVNHVKGQDIETVNISGAELHYKDKITVSAKVYYENYSFVLRDVELISVDN